MRKYKKLITISLAITFYLPMYSQSKIVINEDIQLFVENYLNSSDEQFNKLDKSRLSDKDTRDTVVHRYVYGHVWDLLSGRQIDQSSDMNAIGIYGFRTFSSQFTTNILLKYNDNYEILQMVDNRLGSNRDFTIIIDEVQRYFAKYQKLDHRILPLYIKAITDIYIANTKQDELGIWFDWHQIDQHKFLNSAEALH